MSEYIKKYDIFSDLKSSNVKFTGGNGALLFDEDHNEYLDLNEMTTFLGQNNRYFIDKMNEALNGLTVSKGCNLPYKEKLIRYLIDSTNNEFDKILFTSSGSEATEWAVRIAKKMTGGCEVISYWNSIHGRTYLSSSMSGFSNRKTGYKNIAGGIVFAVYPDCARCEFNCNKDNCDYYCLDFLDRKVKNESSQDIAAVIIEPYMGSNIIVPPKGYLKKLREWTEERGILLILDEIQTGFGRTGDLYFYQSEGISPDMLLIGKGFGNGIHINALLLKGSLDKKDLIAISGGSADSELSCAAACAVYEELINNGLIDNVRKVGNYLHSELSRLMGTYKVIKEIRGVGLAAAIEFNNSEALQTVAGNLQKQGFLFGKNNTAILLKPPLSITYSQCERFISSLENNIKNL